MVAQQYMRQNTSQFMGSKCHTILVAQLPKHTRKRGLVTSCITSCPKHKNVAQPIRSLHLQSNRYYYIFAYYKRTRLFSLELVLDQRGRSTDLVEECVR